MCLILKSFVFQPLFTWRSKRGKDFSGTLMRGQGSLVLTKVGVVDEFVTLRSSPRRQRVVPSEAGSGRCVFRKGDGDRKTDRAMTGKTSVTSGRSKETVSHCGSWLSNCIGSYYPETLGD